MNYLKEAILTTILTVLVLTFIPHMPHGHILDPVQKLVQDFELTDIIYSRYPEYYVNNKKLTLVNIGYLDMSQLAKQVEIINQY